MKYFTAFRKLFSIRGEDSFIRLFFVLFLMFIASTTLQGQTVITHNIGTQGNLVIPGTSLDSYIITGTTTSNTVTIQSGYNGTVTLKDLSITSSKGLTPTTNYGMSGISCITVEGEYNRSNLNPITKVDIVLDGVNTLTYTAASAGCAFQVNQGAQIHINAINKNNDTSGRLTSTTSGSGSAAIGAPFFASANRIGQGTDVITQASSTVPNRNTTAGGNVIIGSGTVTARANQHGAGIGGGWYTYYNGIIIVYGGIVTATSGYHAAGIGSGCPQGTGVIQNFASTSAIIALPPATITAAGTDGGLAGAKIIAYISDPESSEIKVRTRDNRPFTDIYLDLTGLKLTETMYLNSTFLSLDIKYDLKKVKVGTTNAQGLFTFNAEFKEETTFFTDASSLTPEYLGRPYMPEKRIVTGTNANKVEVILEYLPTDISFTDYPSTNLEVGYSQAEAEQNAFHVKVEYKDPDPMTDVSFVMQGGDDFDVPFFLDRNRVRLPSAPTTLNVNDIYYIVLPIKHGRPMGAYSDVLLIDGKWKSIALPGYIRRIGDQKVVFNDTYTNTHIKVTALEREFVVTHPTVKEEKLTLNIDHTNYKPADVVAKYLVTTEVNYEAALAATPLAGWSTLTIPAIENQNTVTTVPFSGKFPGVYYIHWNVESGVVYAHSQSITAPPRLYGGFGPYIIADPVKTGLLSGNSYVCNNQLPLEIKGETSTGGSGDFSYQWEKSTDNGLSWTNVGGDTPDYTPEQLTGSSIWYRRQTTDKQYGGDYLSEIFKMYKVNDGLTLYWKKNATNHNWNDPANWVDAAGVAQNMVPLACTNVYIPSGANNYPSLSEINPNDTPTDVYGSPLSGNITFAYGAELAYPHNLTYKKAFVQYNFGYYGSLISGAQPTENKDGSSGIKMKRGQWYPLAAPLKKMASGDFALGGYPFTWQALADGVSGDDNFYSINFDKSNINNDVDLSTTNNSIAVKAALYKTGTNTTGYNDHKHLQELKGVLEIPYFENSLEAAYHPGHIYEAIAKRSKFFYFNSATLQQIHNPIGQMNRGNEAYRFVFEDKIENVTINGVLVPCYTMKVSPNSTHKHALIGNPFMATINMKRFYAANEALYASGILDNGGYYLYDNTGTGTWNNYSYASDNGVNSLQAFVVVFKSSAANQVLYFPLEGEYALTASRTVVAPRGVQQLGSLSVRVTNANGLGGDYAELSSLNSTESDLTNDVRKLISEENHVAPEIFFVNQKNATYNLLQAYNEGETVVDLGIRCSDTESQLTLSFDKIQEFAQLTGTTPVLVDKYLNVEQDLAQNNTYMFKQQLTDDGKNKYTDISRLSLRLVNVESSADDDLSVVYQQGNLTVNATKGITNVKVYNVLGQLVFDSKNLTGNDISYTRNISLLKGAYVVRVITADDKSVSRKILATY